MPGIERGTSGAGGDLTNSQVVKLGESVVRWAQRGAETESAALGQTPLTDCAQQERQVRTPHSHTGN